MIFKILLLQTWYGLSDYEVEERINDSLLFSEFLLLDMGLPAPDHSTICRFRAELTRLGTMDKLLRELNKQFKKHGISRIDQGAIVDASIVDSPHAPDGSILIEVADDREDLRTEEEQAQEQAYQYELKSRKPGVDTEARWVRKCRHYRYGYKKHVLTDGQGLVESIITTPANCADTVVLPELIEKAELTQGVSVLADKGDHCASPSLHSFLLLASKIGIFRLRSEMPKASGVRWRESANSEEMGLRNGLKMVIRKAFSIREKRCRTKSYNAFSL